MRKLIVLSMIIVLWQLPPTHGASRFEHTKPAGVYLAAGFSTGPASTHVDSLRQQSKSRNAFGRNLRLGFVASRRLLLGFEYNNWLREQQGVDYLYQHCALAATYYLTEQLYAKGGIAIGFSSHKLDESNDYDITYGKTGGGFGLGVGADIRISRSFSLVPAFQYMYLDFDKSSATQIALVLGLGWFW